MAAPPPIALLILETLLCMVACGTSAGVAPLRGYVRCVEPEPPAERVARHRRIGERRAGTIVIVHRGASAFAPENTLEAYAAAMDYGADGCEIDIRRTADGVLYLLHDDMLDHLTDRFGRPSELTYSQLLALPPRQIYGTAGPDTRPPTLAALLSLARSRAMLLHLDIKEAGLEDDIAGMLDAADAWDHVVSVNPGNAAKLLANPKLKTLNYKAPGLFEGRLDVDPEAVRSALSRPGEMIIVDDPRVAARELKRPPFRPVALPPSLRADWEPAEPARDSDQLVPMTYLDALARRVDPDSEAELMTFLDTRRLERVQPDGSEGYRRLRTERILARAWAAQRLGRIGRASAGLIELLEYQVANRSLHSDWVYHGLDGAMAARALGDLGATESAPLLVRQFKTVDPNIDRVVSPQFAQYPLSWVDFHFKMHIIPALGDLRCKASKDFLLDYVAMDEPKARELSPPMCEDATRALLRQDLSVDETASLLASANSAVRGTAILECLDRPDPARSAALARTAPWAVELPRAARRAPRRVRTRDVGNSTTRVSGGPSP